MRWGHRRSWHGYIGGALRRTLRPLSGIRRRRELRIAERAAMTEFGALAPRALVAADIARERMGAELAAERSRHHDAALSAYEARERAEWLNARVEWYLAAARACRNGCEPPPAGDLEREMGWRWS